VQIGDRCGKLAATFSLPPLSWGGTDGEAVRVGLSTAEHGPASPTLAFGLSLPMKGREE